MKKTKYVLISLLCIVTLLGFTGCGKNKTSISADEFCSIMEDKGFLTTDSTAQYATSNDISESYIAISSNYAYQIEFIVLDSDSAAQSMFSTNKSIFESEKNSSGSNANTFTELANYSKYTLLANGKYKVVSRIDNTLIFVNANSDYKEEINSILEELGY